MAKVAVLPRIRLRHVFLLYFLVAVGLVLLNQRMDLERELGLRLGPELYVILALLVYILFAHSKKRYRAVH